MSYIRNFFFITIVLILVLGVYAHATVTLVQYTLDGTPNASTPTAENISNVSTFTSYLGSSTYVTGNPGSAMRDKGWQSSGNYYTFNLTSATGYQFKVTSLQFDDLKSSNGPTTWQVKYKVGSGSLTNADGTSSTHSAWAATPMNERVLSGITALQSAAGLVTFQIVGTGATNNGNGYWSIDNVKLIGDTQARASINTVVTSSPSTKMLTGTTAQYTLTTTNNALSGGTIAAQTLDYTLGFSSQTGLSFVSNGGTGIARNSSNTNTINVNTSTSGTKGGNVNVSSTNAYQQSVAALSSVNVYQAASVTVNGGSSLNIANANTSDGGQRASARVKSLTKLSGDLGLNLSGLIAGGSGTGSVIAQNSSINGIAAVGGNALNGDYSATYQVGLEHDDQTITGTASNDLGTFNKTISKTVTGNSGNQSSTFSTGRALTNLSAKSDKSVGSAATFLDGTLSAQRTISTSWRNAIPGENFNGTDLFSDVLTLTGTDSDIFVLQMSYNVSGSVILPQLGWLKDGKWVNAVEGNTSGTANFINGAYNSSYFHLGNYGVDTEHNVVWAVINHNSEFSTIPEPATCLILGLGSLFLPLSRRKK